jgi:hypothetical protein
MPDAQVVLLCDAKTRETLAGKRSEYEKYVSGTITVNAPEDMRQIEISRWLKTSMRCLVQGDFLFIDCDTVITGDLASITEPGIQFGACLDRHSLIDRHDKSARLIESDKKLGFTSHLANRQINSGVIFCADTPEMRKVFDRWHELWLFSRSRNILRDQPAFNMAIYENASLFTELNGIWNCQIIFNGLPFLADSKIIHYFATNLVMHESPFMLASDKIFQTIKDTGTISDEILELLKNPKTAFAPESKIIAGKDMLNVLNSSFFNIYFWIYKKIPCLFNVVNKISSLSIRMVKYFAVRASRRKDGGVRVYD